MKRIFFSVSIIWLCCFIFMTGCNSDIEKRKVVWISEDYNCENEDAYTKLAAISLVSKTPKELEILRTEHINIFEGLTWQLQQHQEEKEKKFHVALSYFNYDSDAEKEIIVNNELINKINNEYNMQLNINDWFYLDYGVLNQYYYYMFTAEEIHALADYGIMCGYVGSGEGNMDEIDYETTEGITTYFELFGDGIIQYKKGMEISNPWG